MILHPLFIGQCKAKKILKWNNQNCFNATVILGDKTLKKVLGLPKVPSGTATCGI